jgi:hypothetical protein
MLALLAAAICLAISVPLVLVVGRGGRVLEIDVPWTLAEAAQRQVTIAGGLAGFAVTGMVLLVTLARDRAEIQTDAFNATVFMFLTAYLFFVAAAFLFALLPKTDPDGSHPPRIQFALAATLQFRSVIIAWFALRPLMQTFGLDVLADYSGGALTFSLCLGGIFVIAVLYGVGVITLREALVLPAVATIGWVTVTVLAMTAVPELQSTRSSLYLTAALYGLNVFTFLHFSIGLLVTMVEGVQVLYGRHSARLCLIDLQCTMVLLSFLWMSIIGIL